MIAAALSRRIAKARQTEFFLRELPVDTYFNVMNALSVSNAQSFDELPKIVKTAVTRAEESASLAGAAFHLPGKHNQKTHGRRKGVAKGGNLARGLSRLTAMKDAYSKGYTVDSKLESGASGADMDILTLSDGTKVVRKVLKKNETRREYLASRVFDVLKDDDSKGVTSAQIDDNTIITTFADGKTGGAIAEDIQSSITGWEAQDAAVAQEHLRQAKMPGAKEMAMLDALIENHDRHSLNWILSDGRVEPIDQGAARFTPSYMWNMEGGKDESLPTSPIGEYWFGFKQYDPSVVEQMNPRYTRDDIARYRANIAQIRDEFQTEDERQWFDFINRRLDQIESKVTS